VVVGAGADVVVVPALDWLNVMIWPAIVNVPIRAGESFASAVNVTVPVPLPALPVVTWIHGALLIAVQVQPAAVVTVALKVPPVG
jgi:hypothetical protein